MGTEDAIFVILNEELVEIGVRSHVALQWRLCHCPTRRIAAGYTSTLCPQATLATPGNALGLTKGAHGVDG